MDGDLTCGAGASIAGFLNIGTKTQLTLSGGVVTATKSHHMVDSEDANPDDCDTINGGTEGDILFLTTVSSSRTITFKDGTGNLKLAGDFAADSTEDRLVLLYNGASWVELARSNNA
jgi:hypothetical protein